MSITISKETCSDPNNDTLLQAKHHFLTFVSTIHTHNSVLLQPHQQQQQQQHYHVSLPRLCPLSNSGMKRPLEPLLVDNLIYASATIIDSMWFGHILRKSPSVSETGAATTASTALFIREILSRSKASYSMLQLALFYILRIKGPITMYIKHQQQQPPANQQSNINNVVYCRKRMFIAALMAAAKFLNDKNFKNKTWATLANLDVKEINRAEIIFLKLMDYQLYVSQHMYDTWVRLLYDYLDGRGRHLQPPLQQRPSAVTAAKPVTLLSGATSNKLDALDNTMSHYLRRLHIEKDMESWYYATLEQHPKSRTALFPSYYACLFYGIHPSVGSEENVKLGTKRAFPSNLTTASKDEPMRKSSKH
ncbi:hypothetical protein BDF20DRAFT_841022 [Mycotypha africana]|uniref:uncharacterized protein n=1 Tax=Mycotypha africana TaxID=64632 RepID=UPI002300FFFA|nr:uncharacterized protein BDF20DRAFT_841022 [Mycotypha africana]KAI8990817.1 hypothetical protein BDF20DRAFT_841022 [Mycotypha africana]